MDRWAHLDNRNTEEGVRIWRGRRYLSAVEKYHSRPLVELLPDRVERIVTYVFCKIVPIDLKYLGTAIDSLASPPSP